LVSVPLPTIYAAEMTYSFAKNFKIRFNDFCSHITNRHLFENPFSIEVSDVPEKLQHELIELRYDSILHHSSLNEVS